MQVGRLEKSNVLQFEYSTWGVTAPPLDDNTVEEIDVMWDMYWALEREFIQFSQIIPITTNPWYINSMKLLIILQSSCSQIEQLMKLLLRITTGNTPDNRTKYPEWFEALDKEELLSKQDVVLHANSERTLRPFVNLRQHRVPEWWYSNNKTKHDILAGRYMATISTTLNALAALHILNRITNVLETTVESKEYVMNGTNWVRFDQISLKDKMVEGRYKARHTELRHSEIFYHPFKVQASFDPLKY